MKCTVEVYYGDVGGVSRRCTAGVYCGGVLSRNSLNYLSQLPVRSRDFLAGARAANQRWGGIRRTIMGVYA